MSKFCFNVFIVLKRNTEKTLEFIQVSQAVGLCETLTSLHCYFTDFYYASNLYCSELECLDQPNSARRCV